MYKIREVGLKDTERNSKTDGWERGKSVFISKIPTLTYEQIIYVVAELQRDCW